MPTTDADSPRSAADEGWGGTPTATPPAPPGRRLTVRTGLEGSELAWHRKSRQVVAWLAESTAWRDVDLRRPHLGASVWAWGGELQLGRRVYRLRLGPIPSTTTPAIGRPKGTPPRSSGGRGPSMGAVTVTVHPAPAAQQADLDAALVQALARRRWLA